MVGIYLDFYCGVINPSGAEEVRMLRMRELVTTHNRRAENDVYLWQLSQYHGLQESY